MMLAMCCRNQKTEMGLQQLVERRWSAGYERLASTDEKVTRPRKRWIKKLNGRLKGLRLSRSRRLNWKAFSFVLLPKRIAGVYADIVKRMKMEDVCPAIVFSCQWGLPVLSHSTVRTRRLDLTARRMLCTNNTQL